jgi:hypothetical protein
LHGCIVFVDVLFFIKKMRVAGDLVYNKVVGNLIIFPVLNFHGFRPYGLGVIVV